MEFEEQETTGLHELESKIEKELKKQISENKIMEVIDVLLQRTFLKNKDIYNQIIVIQRSLNHIERESRLNLITTDMVLTEKAKITNSIIEIIDLIK